jgi:hypothetical protein
MRARQMMALDRRCDARNGVLLPTPGGAPWQAELRVDQSHPFFFDHPLDHAPGLLLLEGAVQLAQRFAPAQHFVAGIEAAFLKYALFNAPITLRATRQADVIAVQISQGGQLRAEVSVQLALNTAAIVAEAAEAAGPPAQPCAKTLLGKWRAENVLIGTPQILGQQVSAQMLPAPPDCLLCDSAGPLHPLHLLESFMQMQRYLNSLAPDAARMRDILTGVSFAQTAPVLDRTATPTLRGSVDFSETAPKRLTRSATIALGDKVFAHCALHTARALKTLKTG